MKTPVNQKLQWIERILFFTSHMIIFFASKDDFSLRIYIFSHLLISLRPQFWAVSHVETVSDCTFIFHINDKKSFFFLVKYKPNKEIIYFVLDVIFFNHTFQLLNNLKALLHLYCLHCINIISRRVLCVFLCFVQCLIKSTEWKSNRLKRFEVSFLNPVFFWIMP